MKKKLLIIIGALVILIGVIVGVILYNNSKEYQITFDTKGGSTVQSQLVKKGERAHKPLDPTKDGYLFVEWTYLDKTYDFTSEVTQDLVLEAKWSKQKKDVVTFTIKFDSDGGTTISNQIIEKGNKVTKPTDPTKDGYIFKGWVLKNESYNFDATVESNLELKATWEKVPESNTASKPNNNNNNTSNNKQPSKPQDSEVKLSVPTITMGGHGGSVDGSSGMEIKIDSLTGITGIEVYKSTTESGSYTLLKTVTKDNWNSETANVTAQKGEHLYFKVRTYVTNSAGTFYSGYSNILEIDNTLKTPTITKGGQGGSYDGSSGMEISIDSLNEITGVEIYYATSENGNYTLLKTVKTEKWNQTTANVDAQKGEHLYFKVRTYVTNSAGTFYSGYSNILELDNTIKAPTITRGGHGGSDDGSSGMEIKIDSLTGITGIEIYYATSENGNYTLLKTVKAEEWNPTTANVTAQKGEHLYFKVRIYATNSAGTFYSGYSNILEIDNTN